MKKHGKKLVVLLLTFFALQLASSWEAEAGFRPPTRINTTCTDCFQLDTAILGNGNDFDWRFQFFDDGGSTLAIGIAAVNPSDGSFVDGYSLGTVADFFADSGRVYSFLVAGGPEDDFNAFSLFDVLQVDTDTYSIATDILGVEASVQLKYGGFRDYGGTLEYVTSVRGGVTNSSTVALTPVPEPSTFLLLGAGLLGLVAAKFRRRKE